MVTNDANLLELKHKIIEEVARLAWDDKLDDEHKEELVYKLCPGPLAKYRCCVYKDRELVKQRIRLSEGKNPTPGSDSKNIVQILSPACEECPISAYSVTDNCRKCMGQACINACKFGAVSIGNHRSHIDPTKCRECGKCAAACPYNAIVHLVRPCKRACPVGAITYDEYGICVIDEEKCINCGQCIHSCPFGAPASKTYLTAIIKEIKAGKEVYAMCAPATEGQFGEDISMASIRNACKQLGFTDMVEVGLGGDLTAAYESEEWSHAREEGRKMTTSCCSAFINMMKIHFPDLYKENMSTVVSPMCAVSRYLKAIHPGCVTVFIGPCIAKKSEAADKSVPDNADYVMTYGEFRAFLRSKDITLKKTDDKYQEATIYGKKFARSGGVAEAVIECMKERGEDTSEIKLRKCAGGDECRKALTLLKFNKLPEDFVEGMVCPGGCVGGPSKHRTEAETLKARQTLLKQDENWEVLDHLSNYPLDKFSMRRDGSNVSRVCEGVTLKNPNAAE
ncbi:MAG: 4Fe-4S dicluster domain-containing protein [Eubacteriales bacterium]|jgi:[FeFe] hydrogenase (group B1/B3)